MNLKNASILTIISISSLGLLCSCGNIESVTNPASIPDSKQASFSGSKQASIPDSKQASIPESIPVSFSGSYKLVAISCGSRQSIFTPEGATPKKNIPNTFSPLGFNALNLSTNRDFKIKYENNKYSFVFDKRLSETVKCIYTEELKGTVSKNDASVIRLVPKFKVIPSTANDPTCPAFTESQFFEYRLKGNYTIAQNNNQFTLTSHSNFYCDSVTPRSDDKLILTLEKE